MIVAKIERKVSTRSISKKFVGKKHRLARTYYGSNQRTTFDHTERVYEDMTGRDHAVM